MAWLVGWPSCLPSGVTLLAGPTFLHINTYARPAGSTRRGWDNQSMRERLWLGQRGHLTHAEVDSVEWLFYPGQVFSIFGLLKFIKKSLRILIALGPSTSTSSWRFFIVHTFNHTSGCQRLHARFPISVKLLVTSAFGRRCAADTEASRRTREKNLCYPGFFKLWLPGNHDWMLVNLMKASRPRFALRFRD